MSYAQSALASLGEAAPVSPSDLGKIRSQGGYEYQLTPEDILWLARGVQFEGGDHASTIWTYAQRQAKLRRGGSLYSLVRAHSQPINPLWAVAGSGKCADYPDRCTSAQLERRRQARTTPWEGIRAEVREKVLAWARAELGNPVPRAVDFADATVSQSFIRRNPGTEIVKEAGNWYLATPDTLSWPADFVTMQLGSRIAGPSIRGFINAAPYIGAAAVGAAAIFTGWAYWKYGRA
jgi:hypothetical protein